MTNVILFLSFLTLFSGCAKEESKTYYKGRVFHYKVEVQNADSLLNEYQIQLSVVGGIRAKIMTGGQTGVQYTYKDILDEKTGKPLIETTGVIDKSNRVFLHPPRMAYMAFAQIPPMPDVNRNAKIGNRSESILTIIKGHGHLDGKEIERVDEVISTNEKITLFGIEYNNLIVIKGANTNYIEELGRYEVIYWFDQNYGFIRMKYTKPTGETVDLKLKQVEN